MKTYIFNTNFSENDEANDKLITKQRLFMDKCQGEIVISSAKSKYNYNNLIQYTDRHFKSLCYGLYIEDCEGNVKVDKHFPKTKALFIATMWANQDVYVVAKNGFYFEGSFFNNYLKTEQEVDMKDLYQLDNIYLIYLKGDETTNVLLEAFYTTYDPKQDMTIVSYGMLEPENILKVVRGYVYTYSDSNSDLVLLNKSSHGFAIGDSFDLKTLESHVEHINKYYFINKYIELYM